ncbi:hypothetical protein BDF14DRAFT_1877565 [Spinellus fusiger]|nr:hypothetical protein BDF14DRAFT_1877565 [Spinellus fusiger]
MSTQYTLDTPTKDPGQPPIIKQPPVPAPVRPFVSEATTATTIPNSDSRKPRLLSKRTRANTYEYQMTEVEKFDTFTQQMMAFLSDIQRQMATIGLRIQELEAQVKVKDDLITSLQAQINAKSADNPPKSPPAPTPTPIPTVKPTDAIKKATVTYANMAKKNASPAKKTAKARAVLRAQTVRALQEPTGPSVYDFVYLPCRRYLKYGQIRKMLGSLKIQQSRIIDIHFPARGTIALLVHGSFKQELKEKLEKSKIKLQASFDPVAATVIADPKLQQESDSTKAVMAQKLFEQRMSNTCLRAPIHLGYSIARHFGSSIATPRLSTIAFEKLLADLKAKATVISPPATLEKEALQAFGSDSAMEEVEGNNQHTQQDFPDLNPVEHLWEDLDRAVRKKMTPASILQDLEALLVQEWERISKDVTNNLIASMHRRCRAVIEAKDGNTKY